MILVFFLAYLIIFWYLCSGIMRKLLWAYIIFLGYLLSSCSVTSLREAQYVVAQADSLWHEGRMYGMDEGDCGALTGQFRVE